MLRVSLALGVALIASAAHSECAGITNEGERLACYDAQAKKAGDACSLEAFNFSPFGDGFKLTGAMTCAEGRLDYRLYDGDDKFLVSGFTYFQGHAVQIIEMMPAPDQINIKYSVDPK